MSNIDLGPTSTRLPTESEKTRILTILEAAKNLNGKLLYVDSVNGNNGTAARGTTKPFLTLAAANTAAQSGDVIIVGPGTYNEVGIQTSKKWYFMPGSKVVSSVESAMRLYSGAEVHGHGQFVTNLDYTHAISVQGVEGTTALYTYFEAVSVESSGVAGAGIFVDGGAFIRLNVGKIISNDYDGIWAFSSIYTPDGENFIHNPCKVEGNINHIQCFDQAVELSNGTNIDLIIGTVEKSSAGASTALIQISNIGGFLSEYSPFNVKLVILNPNPNSGGMLDIYDATGPIRIITPIETKTTSGDFGDPYEGRRVINTASNNFKIYADGGWRTLSSW